LVDEDAVGHLLELLRHDHETFESLQQVTKTVDDHFQQPVVSAQHTAAQHHSTLSLAIHHG